ncbi:hypothetical protein C2S51_018914 [Perilla frutescens var. frutescens]|nr:hypothetical protein C2S51_018914 [Perilla frutescens var. frutescens]
MKKEAATTEQDYRLVEDGYPLLTSRAIPSPLTNAIKNFNEAQREAVINIGFGEILNLQVKELLHKMTYWILNNFKPRRCEIELADNGGRLLLDEDDVLLILGLPKGRTLISKRTRNTCQLTETWRKRFARHKYRIVPSNVVIDMLEDVERGDWFKRQFIVLLTCCLIENGGNGYIYPNIMHHLQDIDNVSELNWCEFVIRCLVETSLWWQINKARDFRGPILFLILLYVDRVVLYNRYVSRSVPVIREWDTNFLFERQVLEIDAGGFGLGFIEDAFMEINDDARQEYQGADVAIAAIEYREPSNAETTNPKRLPRCRSPTMKDKQSIAQMIIEHSKTITTSMQAILDLVNDLPNEMLNDSVFKRMIDAALMVTKADPSTSPTQNTHKSSSQSDDEF